MQEMHIVITLFRRTTRKRDSIPSGRYMMMLRVMLCKKMIVHGKTVRFISELQKGAKIVRKREVFQYDSFV